MADKSPKLALRKNTIEITFDLRVYARDVLMSTAYIFLAKAYLRLDRQGDHEIRVSLTGKQPLARAALEALAGEFQNELVDQQVRAQLAKQHTALREMIVGRALFGASATPTEPMPVTPSSASAEDDYLADPLGIAVPWEEKHLAHKKSFAEESTPAPMSSAVPDVPASALRRGPGPEKWTDHQEYVPFDETAARPDWLKK